MTPSAGRAGPLLSPQQGHSQAAGFAEGTGFIPGIWGFSRRGHPQVAADVELAGEIKEYSLILEILGLFSMNKPRKEEGWKQHLTKFPVSPANLKASTRNRSDSGRGRGDTKAEPVSSALLSTRHLEKGWESAGIPHRNPGSCSQPPARPYPPRSMKA